MKSTELPETLRSEGKRVLYVSYDGLLEPLGYSQVLKYLERLARRHDIWLISFEKPNDLRESERVRALRQYVRERGIRWAPLTYHKSPSALATAFDISHGFVRASWLVLRHRIQIVHARSYVSAVIAWALKKTVGTRWIFDMRGFWPEEKVESGAWSTTSRLYRTAKWFERQFLLSADCVVSLTEAGKTTLSESPGYANHLPRIEVITTCVDLNRFTPPARPRLHFMSGSSPFTLGYVGAVSRYSLAAVLDFFMELTAHFPQGQIQLSIINQGEHALIERLLCHASIPSSQVTLESRVPAEMPLAMQSIDAGVFFVEPTHSKIAMAPTKMGEFLASGVPCITNAGLGDTERILTRHRAGIVIPDLSRVSLREGAARLVELTRDDSLGARCREAAVRCFSVEKGVEAYDLIYQSLGSTAALSPSVA